MLTGKRIALAFFAVFLASGAAQTTTYYFSNSNTGFANNIWNMSQSIATPSTDLTTDVNVRQAAANRFLIVTPGQTVTASSTSLPAGIQLNGWRTNAPVTGEMETADWTFTYKLQNRAARAHAGRMNMRVWVSTNADMSGATNITGWVEDPVTISFPTTISVIRQGSLNITIAARNYTGEYIYVEFAWRITTAGTNNAAGFLFVSNEGVLNESLATPDALNLNDPSLVLTNPDIGKNNPADNATMACSVTCSPAACTNLNLWVEYNPGAGFTAVPTAATGGLQANAGTFSCGSVASCSNSWSVEGLSNATFPVRCAASSTKPSRSAQSASQDIAVYVGVLGTPSLSPASPLDASIFDIVNISGSITCQSPAGAKAGCFGLNMTARTGSAAATTQISGATDLALTSGSAVQTCAGQFPAADGGSYTCSFSQISANVTYGNGNGDTRFWDIYFNASDTQVTSVDPADRQVVGHVGNSTVTVTSGAISVNSSSPFGINATVSCTGYRCVNVSAYARYNSTTAAPDTPFSTTPNSVPGWLTANPLSCSRINVGGSCTLQFNGTAYNVSGTWLFDVLTNSTVVGTSGANATPQAFTIAAPARPDLNITNSDIVLNNSNIYENDTVQINATFRNSGSAAATNVNVTYYINSTQQCSFVVPSMAPGATNKTTCNWTPATQGNYTILVAVDPANAITESIETNNNATRNVTVNRRLPDLMMNASSLVLNPSTIYENDIVQINATVFNIGNATAANVNVSYYINTTLQCSFTIPSLTAGASNTTSCSWNATTFGNYTITAAADPANTVAETNETNNNATRNVTVNRRLTDLMMNSSSLALNNSSPVTGDIVQINATVFNIGNATAAGVNVSYYANATLLCSFNISSLAVGASNTTTCNWNAATAGDFTITAAADPANTIAETNETNNNASTLVNVGAATDLNIFDDTDTSQRGAGDQITFYANYTRTSTGGPVTGATCTIVIPAFNITANMTYDSPSKLYVYNTSFPTVGTFLWNATCSNPGYQTKTRSKNFTVTSFAFVTADKASYSNCNSVYYRISLFNLTDSSADDALTVDILDALGATRQSASNYTSGGAYSGIYAFTSPLVTGTWTIKANTTCVLARRNFSVGEGNSDIWKIDIAFSPDQGGYASGTTITINSYVYNLRGTGVAGLGANVSANVDGTNVALTDNGLGRYTASYLTAASGAHYFETRAITGSVNVTNRRGFFVR